MRAGGSDSDPSVLCPCDGRAVRRWLFRQCPGLSAVGSCRRSRHRGARLLVVAADDDAVIAVAEGDREDARRRGAGRERRLAHGPIPTAVTRVKYPRDLGPAGDEPGVALATGNQASAAGGECPLARQGRWHFLSYRMPMRPTVIRGTQLKIALNGIAKHDAVLLIP